MSDADAVLAKYPSDFRGRRVEPLGSAGGMSGAQFWRITSPRGNFILRRWPTEHPSPERLQYIHAILRHAAARGCDFLPVPITTGDAQSFVRDGGYLWELAPWLSGAADYYCSPRLEKLGAAMGALAQFHIAVADFEYPAVPGSAGGLNAPIRHVARLRELSSGRLNELSNAIRDTMWPDLAPLVHQFVAALPQVIPIALTQLEPLTNIRLPLQPCIRDIWHDHVLFTGEKVTGLVDFGAVDIDTPATDIARLLGSFAAIPLPFREGLGEGSALTGRVSQTWQEGLAAYNTVRPLSPNETRAAYALDTSGPILAGCNWIRWIYIEGREFENHEQVIERFRRILVRYDNPYTQLPFTSSEA